MSRRSPRLEAGGYYQSDEDSDTSSEVTSVSYKETPVRVFKKRASRASSRASSVASSIGGPSPPPRAVQRTRVTAEPPLRKPPPLPMLCPLSPDPWSGLGPALPVGVDNSSGYSSSEPNATALTAAAARDASASRPASSSAAPNTDIIPKHLRSLGVVVLVVLPCVLSLMTMSGWFSVMTSPDQSSNHLPSSRPMVQDVGVSLLEERVNQLMMQLRKDRDTRGRAESAASDQRFHLDQEVKAISTRLDAQEALNAQMALELERVQSANDGLRRRLEAEPAPPTNYEFTPDLRHALEEWLKERMPEQPVADQMADFALESQGASVVSTRCSENYRSSLARVTLFGIPLWYPSESPRTVLQGHSELLPGRCWAFSGVQGALVVALSHPVTVTHVTVDHLPRRRAPTGRIDSAPRHFQVYGLLTESDSGCLLGSFTYDQHGSSSQTFQLPEPSKAVYDMVEVRVLSNWGHMEYTCLYRFRVHGTMTTAQ